MNWMLWQMEIQRQNSEMMAYTPSQIREMYKDRAEMRAKWLLLNAQGRDEREVKKSASGSAVRHIILCFLILIFVLSAAVIQYAVILRRLAINNVEANTVEAASRADSLTQGGKYRYLVRLYDLMRDASSFTRMASPVYYDYKGKWITNPVIYTANSYAVAFDRESGARVAELVPFISANAVIRLPEDFPTDLSTVHLASLSCECIPEDDGTYTLYNCFGYYLRGALSGASTETKTLYASKKSVPEGKKLTRLSYFGSDFTVFRTSPFIVHNEAWHEEYVSSEAVSVFYEFYRQGEAITPFAYSLRTTEYFNVITAPSADGGELDIVILSQFSPIGSALMSMLAPIIISLVLFMAFSVSYLVRMRRYFLLPLKEIDKINNDRPMWREAASVRNKMASVYDENIRCKNEITRLTTALDYAKEAEENRRVMVSNIAHELKTPLAVVHGYAEGLRDHIAEDKREKYLDTILSETERMDGMVHDMLDLSRLEAGKVKLSRDEFSLTALTRSIFDRLSPLAEAKGLQVSFDADGDCTVIADEARIGQVVTNFASNAVKYTPESGEIRVKIKKAGGKTRFSIENTAVHFTDEELAKVWDTFYRGDKSRHSEGTGLGLAIAKNIVELHGGTVSVRNTDTGVEFGFELGR